MIVVEGEAREIVETAIADHPGAAGVYLGLRAMDQRLNPRGDERDVAAIGRLQRPQQVKMLCDVLPVVAKCMPLVPCLSSNAFRAEYCESCP